MKDLTQEFDRLELNYAMTEQYIKNIAAGELRSLILNGPPGLGKSFMVNQFLTKHRKGQYKIVAGHMTNLSLYHALYNHRQHGEVLVLDDVDSVFSKIEGLNLLKAVMDTQPPSPSHPTQR
jgi:replication-associated recombination protein RarA